MTPEFKSQSFRQMAVISCLFAMKRDALWLMNSLSKWNSWGLRKTAGLDFTL